MAQHDAASPKSDQPGRWGLSASQTLTERRKNCLGLKEYRWNHQTVPEAQPARF